MRLSRVLWLVPVVLAAVAGLGAGAAGGARPAPTAGPAAAVTENPARAKARAEVYKSTGDLAAQRKRDKSQGIQHWILARGNPRMRVVALTFDDGPHPQYTPRLLAILRQSNVKATFFVVGELAQQYPDLVRMERAQGHIVGNHTYHHYNLTKIPDAEVLKEWQDCQNVVQQILNETMRFCRPPGGDYNRQVIRAATRLGLTTVLWTDDPGDYASPGEKTIDRRVLRRVGNGGIILLHDGIQQTIDLLPELIRQLRDQGFRFVTVSELQAGLAGEQAMR